MDSVDAERRERIEYLKNVSQKPPKEKRSKAWIGWLIVWLLIAGGSFAGWWIYIREKPAAPVVQKPTTKTLAEMPGDSKVTTKHYSSTSFGLDFDYPDGWTVTDSGSGLTVASPTTQRKDIDGNQKNGKVVVSFQSTATPLVDFKEGNATAVIDSDKIKYNTPAQTQRAETYISFLNLASSKGTGLDVVYVTGDNGYQKGQAIPEADVSKGDPHIRIAFQPCTGSDCLVTGTTPVTLPAGVWKDDGFQKPIVVLLSSITVQ